MSAGALAGLRVVEIGQGVAAPYCAKLLADLGAAVIKLEPPGTGDVSRRSGPFPGDVPHPERSGLFLYLNANKRGVTLDLTLPQGQRMLRRLLQCADVLIDDNPRQALPPPGLDYADLMQLNPRLVVLAITPYGLSGPYAGWQGHDVNACALGGVSWVIGKPGREPLALPVALGEYQAGANAAAAALVAVLARETTGKGQLVDVATADVLASYAAANALIYICHGLTWSRAGHRASGSGGPYPYTILPCRDGYVLLIARSSYEWRRFVEAMGDPPWASDPRYRDRRVLGRDYPEEMDALLAPWLEERTKEEIFAWARQHKIPFAPVRDIAEAIAEPHFAARQFFVEMDRAETGPLRYPGAPYLLSATPWRLRSPAPLLGEHNAAVYGEHLGYGAAELATLRQDGVI